MKNIVFDLGGVVFYRSMSRCSQEFIDFFAFVHRDPMPEFWVEYDRGALTLDQAKEALCRANECTKELCDDYVARSIDMQETVPATEKLIEELKGAGYKLYVLSNMSREFIDFLRTKPVYRHFDGEVVSCEEHTVKPEPRIYETLLERYDLEPSQTLFIDDRLSNLLAAEQFGINTKLFQYKTPHITCDELRDMLL